MAHDSDWVFLRAALPDLRDYVLSSQIYWILRTTARSPGGNQLPQLTIGNLLLSQARLAALQLNKQQELELAEISEKLHQVREEWRSNWGLKAKREFDSRLNLWQQYLRELRADKRKQALYYPREVRNRAILRLLIPELNDGISASEDEQLVMLDQILRGLSQPGPFVWEPELESGFPQEGFWFLYLRF